MFWWLKLKNYTKFCLNLGLFSSNNMTFECSCFITKTSGGLLSNVYLLSSSQLITLKNTLEWDVKTIYPGSSRDKPFFVLYSICRYWNRMAEMLWEELCLHCCTIKTYLTRYPPPFPNKMDQILQAFSCAQYLRKLHKALYECTSLWYGFFKIS